MASMTKKITIFLTTLIVMTMICGSANAETYLVGWLPGAGGSLQFSTRGSLENSHVGDRIVFFYDPAHNNSVLQVTHKNFETCNTTGALTTLSTGIGQSFFQMLKPGHYYFISSFPGNCQHGHKVQVHVPETYDHGPSQAPSAKTPNPSKNGRKIAYAPAPAPAADPYPAPTQSSSSTSISPSYFTLILVSVLVFSSNNLGY